MADLNYLSTVQVSQALGVSVTTVKRWVDEGRLPAHKTPGGHRKLLLADVLRLVRENDFPRANLARLTMPVAASESPEPATLVEQVQAVLERGEADTLRSLLQGAYQASMPMEQIADGVLAPVLERMGSDWAGGRLEIFEEHRQTQLCLAAVHQLTALVEANADKDRPVALGAAPEGDPYLLPTLLAQLVLLDAGWNAINFGPDTPLPCLREALLAYQPRLLWLSVTHLTEPENFSVEYQKLYLEAKKAGVAVAIGGQALAHGFQPPLPYSMTGQTLTNLADFARQLNPRPGPPRRGRPPRAAEAG
jgi:MerR family transcriptional regulator, light-induced transcriptional regulator